MVVIININNLSSGVISRVIDQNLLINSCVTSYVLYPTPTNNYMRDTVCKIYNELTYGDATCNKASSEIGSYVNEGILTKELLEMHVIITKHVLSSLGMVENIFYNKIVDGNAYFNVIK